jgi:uncharacterized membrane protein
MVNPLDLRTILLAKHAQHVVVIHFPIALFITGVGFDLLSRGRRDSQLATAAYLNLSIAAATVLPAVLTGLLAWQFALEQKAQRAFAMASACSNAYWGFKRVCLTRCSNSECGVLIMGITTVSGESVNVHAE